MGINIFNERTVYYGDSLSEFNRVKRILDINKIEYQYTSKNHEKDILLPRNIPIKLRPLASNIFYQVNVKKRDYEDALYYLRKK